MNLTARPPGLEIPRTQRSEELDLFSLRVLCGKKEPSCIVARDEAMAAIIAHAGKRFRQQAEEFVLAFLRRNGETPGEFITDACKAAGIVPHDDRAFGPVYMALSRRGLIEKVASCQRRKGHGTNGGIVWRLTLNA